MKRKKRYVNIYVCDRAYGGPEEGGWWYDCGGPLPQEDCPLPVSKAFTGKSSFRNHLRKAVAFADRCNEGKPDIGSVICDGVVQVFTEDCPPKMFPETIPHYE